MSEVDEKRAEYEAARVRHIRQLVPFATSPSVLSTYAREQALDALIAAVRAEEREWCAAILDAEHGVEVGSTDDRERRNARSLLRHIAARIRAGR